MKPDLSQPTERAASSPTIHERQIAAIYAICGPLGATLDLDARLHSILAVSVQAVDAGAGSIFLYRASDDQLVFQHVVGPSEQALTGTSMSALSGVAGAVFQSQVPQITNHPQDIAIHNSDIGSGIGLITKNLMTVPLRCRAGKPAGVIQVLNKRQGEFSTDDLTVLEIIASIATAAVETAQLHRDLQLASIARAVGDLSHDLKNKLTPIHLSAVTLGPILDVMFRDLDEVGQHAAPDTAAGMKQAVDVARAFYEEGLQIIQDQVDVILNYTGMIGNAIKGVVSEPQFGWHNVATILDQPMVELGAAAMQADVRLVRDFEPMADCYFDPYLIERAVFNLVNNAIPETPPGGSITVQSRAKGDGAFPEGHYLSIEIKDTGRGMTAQVMDRILHGEANSSKAGGSGLGTRIVCHAMVAHEGSFEGESQEGVGTTFRLKLPLSTRGRV